MKILIVAMHNSIHTARWISQLYDLGWDIHLFPVFLENAYPNSCIKDITIYRLKKFEDVEVGNNVKIVNIEDTMSFATRQIIKLVNPKIAQRTFLAPLALASVIDHLKPDIVHSMEMQHSAYMTYSARKYCKIKFPPWIYSCWGSDIYYFQQFNKHRKKIRKVLEYCNYIFTDTQRDYKLAIAHGFTGELLGIYPAVGGYKIGEMRELVPLGKTSQRKVIVIKGYTGWVYRPFTVIDALRQCKDLLKGYVIALYLPVGEEIVRKVTELCHEVGAELLIHNYGEYDEVLKLFTTARISLASSISDGTPNSMLEAMVMGAFPIQSNTVSTEEWIQHGVNGYLANPEDVEGFAAAIKEALQNDMLVDSAADYNLNMLKQRIDYPVVTPKIISAYKHAYPEGL